MMLVHQKQWEFLKKSFELGKLPHALLFFGEENLGKRKFAIEFSEFILGKTLGKSINPDFVLIEKTGREIQIGQIRDLINKLSFKPYLANFKIAVIDSAHLMTQEAQNCFLKFLEEPKQKTFLILITAYPFLLLPTILSRVQKIRFFSKKNFEPKIREEFSAELLKISQADFAGRFQYAKELSENNPEETLDNWLRYFAKIFIDKLAGQKSDRFQQYSLAKIKDIIRQIQLTKFLISTTNINPRLALEILLMRI